MPKLLIHDKSSQNGKISSKTTRPGSVSPDQLVRSSPQFRERFGLSLYTNEYRKRSPLSFRAIKLESCRMFRLGLWPVAVCSTVFAWVNRPAL